MGNTTLRIQIRTWVREQVEGDRDVRLSELANDGFDHFRDNPEFVAGWLDETLRPVVYDLAKRVLAEDRTRARSAARYAAFVESGAATFVVEAPVVEWDRFREHDDLEKKHVSLLGMTKQQVLEAGRQRMAAGREAYRDGAFFCLLAKEMEDGQTVGEVWTEETMTDLYNRVWVELAFGAQDTTLVFTQGGNTSNGHDQGSS